MNPLHQARNENPLQLLKANGPSKPLLNQVNIPSFPTSLPEDAMRAMGALECALHCSEKQVRSEIFVASRLDFEMASKKFPSEMRSFLDSILLGKNPEMGLDVLLESGALAALLPEVEALVGFGDEEWGHKDVWKHTKQVVKQSVPRIEVRWSALLHDIGKVKTRSISPTGEVHFFGHAEVGAKMFDRLDRRMPLFSKEDSLKKTIRFLILHHLRASQYDASWTDSAVRRFAKEIGEHLTDLFDLSRADITTKRAEKKKRGLNQISNLADRVHKLLEEDAVEPPLPSGIGIAIMRTFMLPPSRRVGEIKCLLEEAISRGEIAPHLDLEQYVEFLKANLEKFSKI